MVRFIWRRIVTLLLLVFLVAWLLLSSTGTPPLKYRGSEGMFPGYRDCNPAQQFVLVYTNTTYTDIAVLEQILSNFALQHQLTRGRKSDANCTIFFVGIEENLVNCSNLAGLRQSLGEQTYIVSVSDKSLAEITGSDFNFLLDVFKQSLLVLRQLLCMEFRDIVFHDSNPVLETTTGQQEDDFQKIISYIGTDFMKRQLKLLNRILKRAEPETE